MSDFSCCGQLWVWHMFCGQDLWWAIPLHIFHWSCWDTLWIPNDHMDLSQTPCVQVPEFSRHWGQVVSLDQSQASLHSLNQLPTKIGSFQFLPTGLHGLCFGCCFSGPLPLRSLTNGPLFRVRFGESLVVRLYSEMGHIHLSIEAQCVTTLLPLGDCHKDKIVTRETVSHPKLLVFPFTRFQSRHQCWMHFHDFEWGYDWEPSYSQIILCMTSVYRLSTKTSVNKNAFGRFAFWMTPI